MANESSQNKENSSSRHHREDLNDVPAGKTSHEHFTTDEPDGNDRTDNQRHLDDRGAEPPAVDESILAELVDEDDTPEERAAKVRVVRQVVAKAHRGPLPAAEDFKKYKEVEPNAPKAILEMASNTNAAINNRINAEADAVRTNAEIDKSAVPRGQLYSFLAVIALLGLAALALVLNRSWFVLLFGVGGIGVMFMNTLPTMLNRNIEPSPESSSRSIEEKEE